MDRDSAVGRARGPPAAALHQPEVRLLAGLAFLAGLVDVTGWLTFDQLFTSHVTGNIVLVAAGVKGGDPPGLARLLALPVFALALAAGYLTVEWASPRRSHLLLLRAQSILLGVVLVLLLGLDARGPSAGALLLAAMLAVAAIGVQCAFVRVSLRQSEATSYMTGNFITLVLAAVALARPGPSGREEAMERFQRTWPVFVAFVAGCPIGAMGVARLGTGWAWAVPTLFSLLVFPLARAIDFRPAVNQRSA